jgi:subtilisin family serine protease
MTIPRPSHARISRIAVVGLALAGSALMIPAASAAGGDGGAATSAAAPTKEAATTDRWAAVDSTGKTASAASFATLQAAAKKNGTVRVIVGLRTKQTAEGALSAAQRTTQRADIARRTADLTKALAGGGEFRVVRTFETVPYVALEADAATLAKLKSSGQAASLQEDSLDRMDLAQSSPLVEAAESWAVGRTGAGQHVAVLDTGIQKSHPFLQKAAGGTKVVSEACYSANATCPGGVTASTAVNSGLPCLVATSDCRHGTHVAGIAAGRGAAFSGVAKEANLLSIRVFSTFNDAASCSGAPPCALAYTSDQIAGLERVYALRNTYAIASANMSLGSLATTAANCDADSRKAIIDNLRSVGIATVIASGNSSSNTGVSTPSCISTAITVGATSKTDVVASFSNSAPLVELLAPGVSINSSVPGNAFASFNGTSMAAPHVAGAWALLNQINNAVTVPTALSALQATGKPVKDADNNVTKPRIKVLAAGTRLADSGLRGVLTASAPGLDLTSDGVGMAHRSGAPAAASFTISGIPAGATVQFARLVWTTIGGPDPSVVFRGANVNGGLLAASADTCWNLNNLQPNRTYYAAVAVPGNGSYPLSGVGGVNGSDGQGASLIVAYRSAAGANGRVYARFGASSASANGAVVGTTLTTSGNGVHLRRPALHVGVGDGQATPEGPLMFGGSAVTGPSFFSGTQGAHWDDDRIPLSASLIPAGAVARPVSVTSGGDCVVMSYAAATWQTSG